MCLEIQWRWKLIIPRNRISSTTVFGLGKPLIAWRLCEEPSYDYPKEMGELEYTTLFVSNTHLSGFIRNFCGNQGVKELSQMLSMLVVIYEAMNMSSRIDSLAGSVFRSPIGDRMNSKTPNGVVIAVFGVSFSAIGVL